MSTISTIFVIREFTTSHDPDFQTGIKIYLDNVPPGTRTDTNEIGFWLDNYDSRFEDSFFVLGLYRDERIVGFAQFVHMKAEKLIVFDYLVIDREARSPGAFLSFVDCIRSFIRTKNLEVEYGVAEIGYMNNSKEPSQESQALARLFKFASGGVIRAPYFQPRLGITNYESEMPAILMLFSGFQMHEIKRETYTSIVKAIYYKHYLRWYEEVEKKSVLQYRQMLDGLFRRISSAVEGNKSIIINGFKASEPAPRMPEAREVKTFRMVVLIVLFIVFITLVLLQVREIFALSPLSFAIFLVLSLTTCLAVFAIFSKDALRVLSQMVTLLKAFSGKSK